MKALATAGVVMALALPGAAAGARPAASLPRHDAFGVRVAGQGPPVVFIAGLACPGEVWERVGRSLSKSRECHFVTLAGFAGQPPIDAPLLAAARSELSAYALALAPRRPVLVGHGLGGFLALWIATTEQGLAGVASVEGVPFLPALGQPSAREESGARLAAAWRTSLVGTSADERARRVRATMGSQVKDPRDLERLAGWMAASDGRSVGEAMGDMLSMDLRAEVGALAVPVLMVTAGDGLPAESRAARAEAVDAQVAFATDRVVVVAENARHFVPLDDPDFLAATLAAFLDRVQPVETREPPARRKPRR